MPRAPKTLEQLKQEAEKAQEVYEKKLEQERKKVMEQFFKDNPTIVTVKDYKSMKKERDVPIKIGTKEVELSEANQRRIEFADNILKEFGTINIEEIKNKMVQSNADEIALASKKLILEYASHISKDTSGKVSFNPRAKYHDFFSDLLGITKNLQSK